MSKTYTITTSDGRMDVSFKRSSDFAAARNAADALRAAAIKAGHADQHYHVVGHETVYVTSTLADILKEG